MERLHELNKLDYELTAAGEQLIQLIRQRQGYFNLKFEYLQEKYPINFYQELKN